ncbi:HvfC/BufC family peptide modification chaperone [Spirosoma pulveris]
MYSQFSALAYALGKELFKSFADQYLEAYPSESYTLNELGRRFPRFLEQSRTDFGLDETEEWPFFLIELAHFEFDLSLIFDEPAEQNELILFEIDPDEVVRVCPLVHHRFPVCQYYLDFTQGKAPELPFPKENLWAVTRLNYRLKLYELNLMEYVFLSNLKAGRTVNETKNTWLTPPGSTCQQ